MEIDELKRAWREGEMAISYPDALLEPIYIDPEMWPPARRSNEKVQRLATKAQIDYEARILEIANIKWNALFWIYGIETESGREAEAWEALTRALVSQHVPGFKVTNDPNATGRSSQRKKPGRPKTIPNGVELNRSLAILKKQSELQENGKSASVSNAIRLLLESDPALFQRLDGKLMTKKSIAERFREQMREVKAFMKSSPLAGLSLTQLGQHPSTT